MPAGVRMLRLVGSCALEEIVARADGPAFVVDGLESYQLPPLRPHLVHGLLRKIARARHIDDLVFPGLLLCALLLVSLPETCPADQPEKKRRDHGDQPDS